MQAARYIANGSEDSSLSGLKIKNTKEGYTVLQLTDHCSSIQLFRDRAYGQQLLRLAQEGSIDTLFIESLVVLGGNALDVMRTLKTLIDKQITIHAQEESLTLNGENGLLTEPVRVILSIVQALEKKEQQKKLEWQRAGIAKAKDSGAYQQNGGRKPVLTPKAFLTKSKNADCLEALQQGLSLRASAQKAGVSLGTAQKVKRTAEEMELLQEFLIKSNE
tara:strand:- start:1755 stop:2411 length:657 start_codon:yes stop_codon:yes gene_type:complete